MMRFFRWLCAALALAAFGYGGWRAGVWLHRRQVHRPPPVVTVTFLEVSSGDCTVIRTPDGHAIVIDAGGEASGAQTADLLKQMGLAQIDLLVLASPADSSVGGVPALLQANIPIQSVWLDGVANPGDEQTAAVAELQSRHVPVETVYKHEAKTVGVSPMVFQVVWPPRYGPRSTRDAMVCRLDYGGQSCLFLGPLTAASEPYLISGASADDLRADVMQVTEHGEGEGSERELLIRVQPEIAVISSTQQTPPDPAALERLQSASADIWRTDQQGTLTVTLSLSTNAPVIKGSRS